MAQMIGRRAHVGPHRVADQGVGVVASPLAITRSTAGRTRSTMERRLRDSLVVRPMTSSSVAITAPHCECPITTTSRVP